MKKTIIYSLIGILFTITLAGCEEKNHDIETCNIRKVAYNWIDIKNRLLIDGWDNSTVERIIFNESHLVQNKNESVDIKGIETYKVTFPTNDEILGPISVYLDQDTFTVLGHDFRD